MGLLLEAFICFLIMRHGAAQHADRISRYGTGYADDVVSVDLA